MKCRSVVECRVKVDSSTRLDSGLSSLPPPRSAVLRLNAICPYYTMFPIGFPFEALSKAKQGDAVLDPFCGRGTTVFAARLRGLSAVGVDSNPVAYAIACAKLVYARPEDVIGLCHSILREHGRSVDMPNGQFWELCYDPETLSDICKIREYLMHSCSSQAELALRSVMLGILHGPSRHSQSYLSNQMPRTFSTKPGPAVRFWQKHGLRPSYIDVLGLVSRRATWSLSTLPPAVDGAVILSDSRYLDTSALGHRFNWVITSPPYYGMRTYVSDQWLRNWFLGGPPDVDYSKNGQLPHSSESEFVEGLAEVWRRTAAVCELGATMIVRFGALPAASKAPDAILLRSLEIANAGWQVDEIRDAGSAEAGNRQAAQFKDRPGEARQEIDVYAILR